MRRHAREQQNWSEPRSAAARVLCDFLFSPVRLVPSRDTGPRALCGIPLSSRFPVRVGNEHATCSSAPPVQVYLQFHIVTSLLRKSSRFC